MPRRRDETPFRIVSVRQLPCEDVGAVYNAVWRLILDGAAVQRREQERLLEKEVETEVRSEELCHADT